MILPVLEYIIYKNAMNLRRKKPVNLSLSFFNRFTLLILTIFCICVTFLTGIFYNMFSSLIQEKLQKEYHYDLEDKQRAFSICMII